MGEYDRAIATAQRLIAKKGMSVTWEQRANGEPADPDKPWRPAAAEPTNKTVSIVFLPYNRENQKFLSLLAGTEVPRGEEYGLMGAVDFEPTLKDTVLRGSQRLGVETIDVLAPSGQPILYTIGFMR